MSAKKNNDPAEPAAPEQPIALPPDAGMVSIPQADLNELLDRQIAMEEQIATLQRAQTGQAASIVGKADRTAEFDAELAELKAEFPDYPLIDVFERRALVGLDANLDIRLKDDLSIMEDPTGARCKWRLRWFNFGKEGRAQQANAEAYVKVRWDELADSESISAGARIDAYVRKGDRGLEVLHKIPRKLYDYKKRRDALRNAGVLNSESGVRDLLAGTVAGMAGKTGGNADQAGSFVKGRGFSLQIQQGQTERIDARQLQDDKR